MMESAVSLGMCRCCASEGAFKDIKSTYHWMGEEEIYADMLKECFDIILNTSEQGQDGGICEVCITQLRNAINFKKQVLHTEDQFQKHLQNKTLFRPHIVKVEVQGDEDSDDNMGSGDEGFSGAEFEVPIKTEVDDPKPKKRAAAKASATTTRASAKKAKADNGETSTKRGQRRTVEEKETNGNDLTEHIDEKELKRTPKTELLKHRSNIKEVLLNSNATPVRRYGGIGYMCCYCPDQFERPAALKKHTLENHRNISEANFMKNMSMSEYIVKLDITSLKCKLCDSNMNTLDNLIDHLQIVHEKKIDKDHVNHIFPFKFGNDLLICNICSSTFSKFRTLVKHMPIHYRNYICAVCDTGFATRSSLTQHLVNHKTGAFVCDYCPKLLPTLAKKRIHERASHTHVDVKYKCGYCQQTFKDHGQKEAHVTSEHGVVSLKSVCQACNKVCPNRKRLNIHIKRDHLMERPHKCKECDMSFYFKEALRSHMVKHTGLKEFQCSVCLKKYGRRKTLISHMQTHSEKRFKCEKCARKFTRKCNWRGHMRSKHAEIV